MPGSQNDVKRELTTPDPALGPVSHVPPASTAPPIHQETAMLDSTAPKALRRASQTVSRPARGISLG